VSEVILLDAGVLGLLSNPNHSPETIACRNWAVALQNGARTLIVPEIADYEVRRELLRAKLNASIVLLDLLGKQMQYLPISTTTMRRAAEFWAEARQAGKPTAGDKTIDADVILAAQAVTLEVPERVIATTNLGHLARYTNAKIWNLIIP